MEATKYKYIYFAEMTKIFHYEIFYQTIIHSTNKSQ